MSEENVEIAEQLAVALVAAVNDNDIDAVAKLVGPGWAMDWTRSVGPHKTVYIGIAGMTEFMDTQREAFENFEITPLEHIPVEDGLVVPARVSGRGRGSGVEVEAQGATYIEFRDGKPSRMTLYQSKEEALKAAGLSE
jgi:SnoaL-like protein